MTMNRGGLHYARVPREDSSSVFSPESGILSLGCGGDSPPPPASAIARFASADTLPAERQGGTGLGKAIKLGMLGLLLIASVGVLYSTTAKKVHAYSKPVPQNKFITSDVASEEKSAPPISSDEAPKVESASSDGPRVREQCPHWAQEFADKYERECRFWLDEMKLWDEAAPHSKKIVAYSCPKPTECRGWGDRLGGIQSAFQKALADRSRFRIGHPGLQHLFSPCLLKTRATNWASNIGGDYHVPRAACMAGTATHCYTWANMTCHANVLATENTNRACIKENTCKTLQENFREDFLDPARVFGCGLRAILEPSDALMTHVKLPFKDGREHTAELNLREISQIFKQYYVIGVHFRMGDAYAFHNRAGEFTLDEERYVRPFRCAKTLESHLMGSQDMINGKEVRWFVTSDSYRLKRLANQAFRDRVMFVDMRPQHVALHTKEEDLSKTIAEWYLIGLSDQLVVNKIGTHNDFYHGRVSAFPKTSWITHLKHIVYDAGTCQKYSLPFEGIWEDLNTKTCGKHSLAAQGREYLRQEHLDPLLAKRLSFPDYYMDAGRIVSTNSSSSVDESALISQDAD